MLSKTVKKPATFDTPGPELSLIMLSAIVIEPGLPLGSLGGAHGPPWGPSLTSPPDEFPLMTQLLTVVTPSYAESPAPELSLRTQLFTFNVPSSLKTPSI